MKWTGVFLLYATAVAVIAPVQAEGGVILETSPSSNHDPTTDACWLSSDCNAVLANFSACYEQSGPMNPLTEQAAIYKSCVCNSGGGYREYVWFELTIPSSLSYLQYTKPQTTNHKPQPTTH